MDVVSDIREVDLTTDFLKEISFNRIKSDYDMLKDDGVNLLKNLFQELIKNISKEELDKINIRDNFIEFINSFNKEELEQEKLPILLSNKYQSLEDAIQILGDVKNISDLFIQFQKHLYEHRVA
mgnify:CR=1 FL=1